MEFLNFFKKNVPSKDMEENNLRGKELEDAGDIKSAITFYEYNVKHRFDGNFPYDRLAIIYRKQKEYGKEIDVLKQAIDVFINDVPTSRPDREKKIKGFNDRLQRADELLQSKILHLTKKHSAESSNKSSVQKKEKPTNRKQVEEQILKQKSSIKKNGFSFYEYVACSDACPKCKTLNGKIFPVSQLRPGVNAPPMCDHCRCSISAHIGEADEEYEKWLDFLGKGGTTKEWESRKKKKR